MAKRLKRPRDPVQLAKLIGDIATEQLLEERPVEHSAAAELGRKGGAARAAKMSKDDRSRAAKQAAQARWRRKAET